MPTIGKTKKPKWHSKGKPKSLKNNEGQAKHNQYRWTTTSRNYRALNPLCEICLSKNLFEPAGCVDHIIPVAMGGSFYDERNHMSLCDGFSGSCHRKKTAKEMSGEPLIDWTVNSEGERIPKERSDIFKII